MLRNGIAAAGQLLVEDLRQLPGTFTTTNASTTVTATVNVKPYVKAGDLLIFSGDPTVAYGIASISADGLTITLVNAKSATGNGAGQTALKDNFVIPNVVPSPAQANGAGTASITAGTKTVTGSGTSFNTLFVAGDAIHIGGETHRIRSVDSATQLTLETNHVAGASAATYKKSNFTNKYGRFGAMAVGTGTTAVGSPAVDTGLEAELTTGGLGRRSGSNVLTTVQNPSSDTYRVRLETTWTVTATSQAVNEVIVANDATANRGVAALRQVFAAPLNLVLNDLLNIVVTVDHTSSISSPSGGGSGVVVNIGLQEACKLFLATGSDRQASTTTIGSDWDTKTGTLFDAIALGTGTTAVAKSQQTLVTEATSGGAGRINGDAGGAESVGVQGTIMQEPQTDGTFGADTQTVFAGDTVQWRAKFSITATIGVNEQGVFNGSSTTNGDPEDATGSRMLLRQLFGAVLNLVNGDTYYPVIRVQST